jgi:hypothetical protein
MAGNGLIDTVINHFLRQVIGARGIGVHPRALADRVQATQYLDGGGIIYSTHNN